MSTGGYGAAIGGYLQGIGGTVDAFAGGGDYRVLSNVKNQGIQNNIDRYISGFSGVAGQNSKALGDYITKYLAGAKDAATRTGQEIGSMDQFYNGGMASQLAQLRAERAASMTQAATLASQQAFRGQNQSNLGLQGSGGSYNTRMLLGSLQPIQIQAALDANNQQRSDLGYLTQNQIALTGQRQGLANALAAYQMAPVQARMGLLTQEQQYLGGLTNLDQANKFYGLQYVPNTASQIAASLEATGAGLAGGQGAAAAGAAGAPSTQWSMGGNSPWGGGYAQPTTGSTGGGGTFNPAMYSNPWGTAPSGTITSDQNALSYAPGAAPTNYWGQSPTYGGGGFNPQYSYAGQAAYMQNPWLSAPTQ